jgi:hypothetical protein
MDTDLRRWMRLLTESSKQYFSYLTSCTDRTAGPHLEAMMDGAKKVPYKELLNAVGRDNLMEQFPQYFWGSRAAQRGDIALHKDPYVYFYRSTFRGEPCYFVQESGIENIFVAPSYWDIDWDIVERQPNAKRLFIDVDGRTSKSPFRSGLILSLTIAGTRIKVVQSSFLTLAAAETMRKLLTDMKVTEIDDDGEAPTVPEYTAFLQSVT